jgi:predicted HTH transcriptional regulator
MKRIKIFISSVQAEFAKERKALNEYLLSDPLLGKFFDPFLFELLPSMDQRADKVYLREVEQSDIYLGLLGKDYGFENKNGVSPTEQEFDHASAQHKTRLIFLTNHAAKERHPKQAAFVVKAQEVLVRKRFGAIHALKASVYAALVRYLEEKEIIRSGPFDATFANAGIDVLDSDKIVKFVRIARSKRGFPLSETAPTEEILTHLNLLNEHRVTNAAILLFGKQSQKFFISSEIRCAHFHGTEVAKPIPSYKVFKGDVFELVDQAVDFVLSKLDYSIGTRKEQVQIPGGYEIPKEIVAEAIVNAVAHRDYTSNGSVQVMLFSDRLEIWNPGSLPLGWTTEKLKQLHSSVPANPLLAEPMYLAGYIERLGTGTKDMVRIAVEVGLREPDYVQEDTFKAILYRPSTDQVPTKLRPSTDQVPQEFRSSTVEVRNLVIALEGEMSRTEIQDALGLKHKGNFRVNYIDPALVQGFIELKYPENPNHPKQKYRLTKKGEKLKQKL